MCPLRLLFLGRFLGRYGTGDSFFILIPDTWEPRVSQVLLPLLEGTSRDVSLVNFTYNL